VSALRLAAVMPELARIVNVVDYLADSYAEQEAECEKSGFMGHGRISFLSDSSFSLRRAMMYCAGRGVEE
jgi:hypothetical protein